MKCVVVFIRIAFVPIVVNTGLPVKQEHVSSTLAEGVYAVVAQFGRAVAL